jgi:hypothetical protein
MAAFDPIPDVLPTGPPQDYQQVQTNPQQFGADVAAATGGLGATIEDQAFKFQQLKNETDAFNATADASAKLGQIDLNYRQLKGTKAAEALPSYTQKIKDLQAETAGQLQSPAAKMQFMRDFRGYADRTILSMGQHSGQQAEEAHIGSLVAGITADQSVAVRTAGVADIEPLLHGIVDKTVLLGQSQGWEKPQVDSTVQKYVGDTMHQIVMSRLGQNDGASAKAIFDKALKENVPGTNLPLLDAPHQAAIAQELHSYTITQGGRDLAAEAFSHAASLIQPPSGVAKAPPDVLAIVDAIHKQESGGALTAPTSAAGAVGPMQIKPETFKSYTLPGETLDINSAQDQKIIAQRIIEDGLRRSGGNPAGAAVAYISGAGNVAPPGSPTPWRENFIDPSTGLRVSDYVGQVSRKLGIETAPTSALRADAYEHINNSLASEEVKQAAREAVNQQYQATMIASAADEKAKKDANDQAADGYIKRLHSPDANQLKGVMDDILNDPHLTYETRNALANAAERQVGSDIKDASGAYGPGFWDAYKKVTAPNGDPNRIADPNAILTRAGPDGDLTLAGAEKLRSILMQNQASINDQAVNTTKVGLLNYAKQKLSFDEEMAAPGFPGLKDPKGVAAFNAQFIPKFEAAYDEWVKAGKNPWEFLTQKKVDEMAEGIRPKSELARDRLSALGTVPEEVPGTPLPPAPQGAEPEGWKAVVSEPPPLDGGGTFNHAAWGKALEALLKDPSPENYQRFNASQFGKAGYDAATLVKKMTEKPEPSIGETIHSGLSRLFPGF